MPAPAPCCGRGRRASTCWCSPGLSPAAAVPYKSVQELEKVPPVEIYTTRYCPYCIQAKALLKRKGVEFTEIDVGRDWERRSEMVERAHGRVTVPQIFIGAT